jgi:hypothetical protein
MTYEYQNNQKCRCNQGNARAKREPESPSGEGLIQKAYKQQSIYSLTWLRYSF